MRNSRSRKKQRNSKAFPSKNEHYSHQRSIDYEGMLGYLPNPDVILRELGENQKAYENILSDAHLHSVIQQRKTAVASLKWDISRDKAPTNESKFVKEVFENLDIYRIITDALEAPFWGMSPLEVIWKTRDDGKVVPLQVIGKPAEWFQYDPDNILRFISRNNPTTGEIVPPRKVLNVRHNPTYKNPYGDPLLSKVFWPVTFKKGGFKFWVAFTERYGSPMVVGKVPRAGDKKEYSKLADILAETVQDGVIVMPEDSSVEIIDATSGGATDAYEKMVKFCNSEISKAIIGQTLTTEASETGSYALGNVHADIRGDIVDQDKRLLEDSFNLLIRWIIEVNFGDAKEIPKFSLYHEEQVNKTLAERDKIITDMGVKFTPKYFEKNYKLEKDEFVLDSEKEETTDESNFSELEFRESPFKDQKAIDALVNSFGKADLQSQASYLEPIRELNKTAKTFGEFKKGLLDIFDDIRPEELEIKLRDALFVSEVWGNLTGSET